MHLRILILFLFSFCLVRCGSTTPQFTVIDALPTIQQATSLALQSDFSGSKAIGTYKSSVHTQFLLRSFPTYAPLQLSIHSYASDQTQLLTSTTTLSLEQWNDILARIKSIPLETTPYKPIFTHTDDYPFESITLTGEDFTATFSSKSQDEPYLPWQAQINNQTFTINSKEIATVWKLLQPALQPETQQQFFTRVMAES